jgi:hypothetical protein
VTPHPGRLRCRRSAQPAARSCLRLAGPGAVVTLAVIAAGRATP